jgi:glutathione synthase/RimK-type ligase-like ATP-grasp enzyme
MNTSKDIVLVTCDQWPSLSTSDTALADELGTRGHRVRALPWNSTPIDVFTSADLVVLRANWDYHHDLEAFGRWLDQMETGGAALHNPVALVRPNLEKSYLAELVTAGFRTPSTLMTNDLEANAVATALDWVEANQLDRVVVKPAWGASGHGVELVEANELEAVVDRWRRNPDRRPMLIQEFVPQIRNGEIALVFFAGDYSHAMIRRPADGDFRVNSQYGGTMAPLADVDPSLVEFGAKVEATLVERATYVRIDVVADAPDHIVMEVEVNEPALGLDQAPGSAARFASALLG